MSYGKKHGKSLKGEYLQTKELVSRLLHSEMWAVIRMDDEGVHLHTPDMGNLAVLGLFLSANPEILEQINEFSKSEAAKKINWN